MNIFIFGDSNSWGFLDDGSGLKYEYRWPITLHQNLKKKFSDIVISEDSLPGRTTNLDDPQDGDHLNGSKVLKASILSQSPVDHVLIMLGTNDLKSRFNRDTFNIAQGLEQLGNIVKQTKAGIGSWNDEFSPNLSIISPLVLGDLSKDKNWNNSPTLNYSEWEGAFEKSKKLSVDIRSMCEKNQFHYIDGNIYTQSSPKDPIHWEKKSHHIFGEAIAKIFMNEIFY